MDDSSSISVKMNKNWRTSTRAYIKRLTRQSINQILPTYVLQGVQGSVEEPGEYPKLPFMVFLRFMIICLLWRSGKPSTRRIAGLSKNLIIQSMSGVVQVTHQAIANRLRTVSKSGIREVLALLSSSSRGLLPRRSPGLGLLKLFDCTTVEGSVLFYNWAAPNGDKNAIRLALNIDYQSDTPIDLINASETTSDNTVFPSLVEQLNPGETGVFDAGFTKLVCFQRIAARRAFWIARMANIYSVSVLRPRMLHPNDLRPLNGWTLQSDDTVLVGTRDAGGPVLARRLIWTKPREEDPRVLWTNHFRWRPKRIFEAYHARWRIEVHFRWLKSELGLNHLPSHDPGGLEAFFLLVLLAWLFLRVYYARSTHQPWERFSCRDALIDFQNSLINGFVELLLGVLTDS